MTTLQELLAQQKDIESKITTLRATERSEAIVKIRSIVDEFEFTPEEIFSRTLSSKTRKTTAKKVAASIKTPDVNESVVPVHDILEDSDYAIIHARKKYNFV